MSDTNHDITENAMLVQQTISKWTARKHDRKISAEVAETHDAGDDAGRYNKQLVAKVAMAAIQSLCSDARADHYANTLPWDDKGSRVLTVDNFDAYVKQQDAHRERMITLRREFKAQWAAHVDEARERLGSMFDESDYPDPETVEERFVIDYTILPIPDAKHFLAKLGRKSDARIRADITRKVHDNIDAAVRDLYERLGEAIAKVVDRVQDEKRTNEDGTTASAPRVFRNTLIDNLRDIVDVVPRLNLTGDPQLAKLCETTRAKLCKYDATTLRPTDKEFNPAARAAVQRDAKQLAKAFAGYFGGAS